MAAVIFIVKVPERMRLGEVVDELHLASLTMAFYIVVICKSCLLYLSVFLKNVLVHAMENILEYCFTMES
jgi:hypothetical protein